MKKVFLIGDNSKLNEEIINYFNSKFIFLNEINDSLDIIIEATNFDREIKFKNLKTINSSINKSVPIFSSSLCIPLIEQATISKSPERLIGIGLYNTFSKNNGIEITKTGFSSNDIFIEGKNFLKEIFSNIYDVKDRVGMISLRIISLIINEAYLVLQEGTSSKEDIDIAMKLGTNYPFGPIEWSEKIGLDLIYNILKSINEEFQDDRYRITPLLKEKYLENLIKV